MPESLPPDVASLVKRTHAFARDILLPLEAELAVANVDRADARRRVIEASARAGLFALAQPPEAGGAGAGPLALVAVRDAIASHNPPDVGAVFGPRPGILATVGEPLRSTHLLPMLRGRRRGGFALTEPRDSTAYTRADRDGDWLVLNGRKSYVTAGAEVDFVNVVTEVGEEGRAVLVVDTATPGVICERVFETLDGGRHAAFRFQGARIPAAHLVGPPGEGMRQALRQIGDMRLLVAAEAVGLCRWVIVQLTERMAATVAGESARLRYGDLRIKVFAARSTLYRAARLAESGGNSINEEIAAKVLATETLAETVDQAIQLTGGAALEVSHPLAVLYRKVRVMRVAEGLSDTLRLGVARGALELGKGEL